MIKSFRGIIADGGEERIRLQTPQGKVGYRIVKFEAMPDTPGANQTEAILKLYMVSQGTIDALVDFSDPNLLATLFQATSNGSNEAYAENLVIVFDNRVVNQDIYITAKELAGSRATNYHLELETIPLSELDAEYTTIKDLRAHS